MTARAALLFPGQGAQYMGMGLASYQRSEPARRVFESADAVLGFRVSQVCFDGPESRLRETRVQQPAIVACSLAIAAAYDSDFDALDVRCSTGHSLGLYSALVRARSLDLEQAVGLVALRGELMQQASDERPGSMAAVLGLGDLDVEQACADASCQDEIVVAANYNAPGQVVISGAIGAVERAIKLLKERGARRVISLAVAGAFHSPLMASAAKSMAAELQSATIADPAFPIVANGRPRMLNHADEIRTELVDQMLAPVRWSGVMRSIATIGVTLLVDCGPGEALAGLASRNLRPEEMDVSNSGVDILCLDKQKVRGSLGEPGA